MDLIAQEVKFTISLISGRQITNINELDFNKYENAFVDKQNIYSYNAIESITISPASILEVL